MIFHCLYTSRYKKSEFELRRAFKFPLESEKRIRVLLAFTRFPDVTNYGTNIIRLTFRLYVKNDINPFNSKRHKAKNGIVATTN